MVVLEWWEEMWVLLSWGFWGEMLGREVALVGETEQDEEVAVPVVVVVATAPDDDTTEDFFLRRICSVDSLRTRTLWPLEARSLIRLLDMARPGKFLGEYTVITEESISPRR